MSAQDPNLDKYRFKLILLHPRYWLTWVGLLAFFVVTLLPMSVTDRLGSYLGDVARRKNNKRVHIVKTNLSLCFSDKSDAEIDDMVAQNFQAHYRSLIHYFILWWRPVNFVRKKIKKVGFEEVNNYQSQNKNIIILLAHSVGLEFGVAGVSMDYVSIGPYKSLPNPVVDWVVANARIRFGKANGTKMFTREDGLRPLIRETRAGKILVYLADEDLGKKNSVFVPFFGVQKATIPVLGRLAKSCDAVVLPAVVCYDVDARCYSLNLLPEIQNFPSGDDEKDSLAMNKSIERLIDICPAQYLWTLRYFRTRPEGEASVYE